MTEYRLATWNDNIDTYIYIHRGNIIAFTEAVEQPSCPAIRAGSPTIELVNRILRRHSNSAKVQRNSQPDKSMT